MHEAQAEPLDERSKALRRLVLRGLAGGQRGHLGSSMSLIELLRVLYDDVLQFHPDEPRWVERDRLILSKGHGCLGLYALLADQGFFPVAELDRFCHSDSFLGGHPEYGKVPGVEASTGALGHGLSIGVGMALAARIALRDHRVVVITGDGEINEGSNWEAALSAAKHRLGNLILLVDYNKLQSYGLTQEVADLEPLTAKWAAFGFHTQEVNGHSIPALRNALRQAWAMDSQPSCIICHTVKGKGFPFAEYHPDWHHKSRIDEAQIQALQAALEAYPMPTVSAA